MGLHRLGHDVYFVEDSDDYESCFDPVRCAMTSDPSFGLAFASAVFDSTGLSERWAYFDAHRNVWSGPAGKAAPELFRTADLLLNISGVNPIRDWTLQPAARGVIHTP